MWRRLISLFAAAALAGSLSSSTLLRNRQIHPARAIDLAMTPSAPRGMNVKAPLHFLRGWTLSSNAPEFGGISALVRSGAGFIALSDGGNLIRFALDARGRKKMASVETLPEGCGIRASKQSRDSESMTSGEGGMLWIGFEFDHRICRVDSSGAARLARPREMRGWPNNRGAEAMARLADSRLVVIGESRTPNRGGRVSPGLIFDGDPADPRTRMERFDYRIRNDYRATDAAVLPDGKLLILQRTHTGLLSLPGRLGIVEGEAIRAGKLVKSRTLLTLDAPDLDQNFEAVAVSQARGRTFVWLMSDDNFMPLQQTMLLLFEYRP